MRGIPLITIVYNGIFDAVVLPDGRTFKKGEPVEVDESLGRLLAAQSFKIVKRVVTK